MTEAWCAVCKADAGDVKMQDSLKIFETKTVKRIITAEAPQLVMPPKKQ